MTRPLLLTPMCLAACLPAPPVTARPLPSVVRASVPLFDTDADQVVVLREGVVEPADGGVVDTTDWPDGSHILEVMARSRWSRWQSTPVRLVTDNTPPEITVADGSTSAPQGGTLAVFVRTDEPATVSLSVLGRPREPYPVAPRAWRSLVGVPIREPAGPTPLAIEATDNVGNTATVELSVHIEAVEWPFTGRLSIAADRTSAPPEDEQRMRAERDAVLQTHTLDKRWLGPFLLPTEGTRSSPFGAYREYPDGERRHHDAVDIASRRKPLVVAPAAGRVLLAHEQAIHGNAVILDHGQRVFTLYSHLDRIDVAVGDDVSAGAVLGVMGSTGRSTGPHLHWGLNVDGVAVDPMPWTEFAFDPPAAWFSAP